MSSNATSSNQDLPKVVITIGVLAGALVIGLIVAKIADYLYERSSVRDDASDISEHTRELLKTQLELMRMGKNKDKKSKNEDPEEEDKEKASKAMSMWSNKVKSKAKLNPIPESGEGGDAACPIEEEGPGNGTKTKGKGAVSYQISDKKDDSKKYQDAVKVWNEVEKKSSSNPNSPAKAKSDNTPTTSKGQSTASKSSPQKAAADASTKSSKAGAKAEASSKKEVSPSKSDSKDDAEFQVPDVAAASTSSKGASDKKPAKSTTIVIPENLNKNADIRPITPAKVDESMPGYMRPKTPFTPRNFSRYNGTVDPMRPATEKGAKAGGKS